MDTHDCFAYRDEILARFLRDKSLSPEARLHYINCVDCINAVTIELSKACNDKTRSHEVCRTAEEAEAARTALEQGRRVLERELGIPAAMSQGCSK